MSVETNLEFCSKTLITLISRNYSYTMSMHHVKLLITALSEYSTSPPHPQAAGFERVRNRKIGATCRQHDPLGAGLYVFRHSLTPRHFAHPNRICIEAPPSGWHQIVCTDRPVSAHLLRALAAPNAGHNRHGAALTAPTHAPPRPAPPRPAPPRPAPPRPAPPASKGVGGERQPRRPAS
jgi:hypothetical protein